MQDLPDAAVLLVLTKLAIQDPLSLLLARHTCQTFRRVAADNPSIWKAAFYGAALWKDLPHEEAMLRKKQSAELEAFLEESDLLDNPQSTGYKKLVEARVTKRTCSQEKLQTFREVLNTLQADVASFLFVLRLRGSVLLWGSRGPLSGQELESLAWSGSSNPKVLQVSGSSVHALYSTEKVFQGIRSACWPSLRPLSLEVYSTFARSTDSEGSRPMQVGISVWQNCFGQCRAYPVRSSVEAAYSVESFLLDIRLESVGVSFRHPGMQIVEAIPMLLSLNKNEVQQVGASSRAQKSSGKEQEQDQRFDAINVHSMDLWLH